MKNLSFPVLLSALLIPSIATIDAFAQKDADLVTPLRQTTVLADPSPSGFGPVTISAAEAGDEVRDNSADAGFAAAFFPKAALADLMSDSKAVGVRFYNAMDDKATGVVNLVAVAVKADGSEINPLLSKSYVLSQPIAGSSLPVKVINKSTAKTCVDNACGSKGLTTYTSFFARSVLDALLGQSGAAGLKLIPASRKFEFKEADGSTSVRTYRTMMAIGVTPNGAGMADLGPQYLKSLEPCPYHCPSDKYLLAPARY
ncbi:MAG: hypothetical protein K9J06_16000 [Flavobacteriales bacterium]|nr:hypothetical protein [Flavobacteriales bacterium]